MARSGRHAEGARTRERVLESASKLIASRGYAATSVAKISREAGVNSASIFWAFGNKEGLLAAVMERAAQEFFADVPDFRGENLWDDLAGLADAFASGPEFLRLLLVLSLERRDGDPAVLEAARRVRAQAVDGLAEAYQPEVEISNPFQRRAVCQELARFTLMLLDGIFVASQIEPDSTDLPRAFRTIAAGVRATRDHLVANACATPPTQGASR
jgi:AcrR family transcriptional regulator